MVFSAQNPGRQLISGPKYHAFSMAMMMPQYRGTRFFSSTKMDVTRLSHSMDTALFCYSRIVQIDVSIYPLHHHTPCLQGLYSERKSSAYRKAKQSPRKMGYFRPLRRHHDSSKSSSKLFFIRLVASSLMRVCTFVPSLPHVDIARAMRK